MAEMNNENNHPIAVNYLSHPLTSEGAKHATIESGATINQVLKNLDLPLSDYDGLMVWVNGKPIEDYENFYVYDGDVVNIRPIVKGDNAGAIISTIAAVVISIYFPPAGAAMGMGTLATGIATAALIYGSTMLIQSAFPPPEPQEIERKESYLLTSTRNRARMFEALPLVIGKIRMAPDSASATFGRFEDNVQTVNQVYHFGLQTGLKLEDWRIGDTPLSKFQNPPVITLPDASGNLPAEFNDTEVIQGAEVKQSTGPFIVTTQVGSIGVSVDFQVIAYDVGGKGNIKTRNISVSLAVYDVSDDSQVFRENRDIAGSQINENKITISTGKLPKGQYRVEITKNSKDQSTSKGQRQLTVVAVKSTQEDNTDYSNQYRVGLSVEASSQITGIINQLTALAYDSIPVYENQSWTIKPTDNPAWWLLWFARGKRDRAGRLLYGGGLGDYQIDIDSIIEFGAWCDRKKLTVGMLLNKNATVKKVLNIIARCGRGEITWGNGKLGVIWDDDQAVPVAVFSPSNIRANSFKINYNSEKTADEIIVNFLNKDNDYKPDSVRVPVGNTQTPERPTQFQFTGCLDADMAGREANLIAAAQLNMRRTITWETDIEGIVARRGDVVLLSHDIIGWSQSGRVVAGQDRQSFVIDDDIKFTNKGFIGIRTPDGKYETFKVQSVTGRIVSLATAPAANFKMPGETNSPAADWMWFYDEGGKPGRAVKITDVQVKNRNTLSFTAKDYSSDYYNSETGDYIHKPKIDAEKPVGNLVTGVLAWETFRIDGDRRTQVLALSWSSISSVNQYTVKIWNDKAGGEQTVVTPTVGARFDVAPGLYNYRINAVDAITSQVYSAVGRITITGSADVAQVKEFTATGILGGIVLRWTYPDDPINMRYVKIRATYNAGGVGVIENFQEAYPVNVLTHTGLGVAQSVNYELTLVDSEGNESPTVTVTGITSDNIQQIIDAIEGEIDDSALAKDLKTKIDKIDDVEKAAEDLKTNTDAGFKDVRNELDTAEKDLKNQLTQTNDAVNSLSTTLNGVQTDLDQAKKDAQKGINDANSQISSVSSQLTRDVNDVKAAADQTKKDLAAALEREKQANESIKTELKQLIATSGVQTFSQATKPSGKNLKAGDIWFKTDSHGKVINTYRYDGKAWQAGGAADAKANAAAIMREQTARANADTALGNRIDMVNAHTADNAAAIRQQQTAYTQADNALAQRIDNVTTTVGQNKTAIEQEVSARTSADTALGKRIDSINTEVGAAKAAISNEATARAKADQALTTRLETLTSTVEKNTTAISSEATARSNADSALGRRIDQIKAQSDQNKAAITSEASARAAADGALGIRVDSINTAVQNKADNTAVTALNQRVSSAESTLAGKAAASEVAELKTTVESLNTLVSNFDFEDGLKNWVRNSNTSQQTEPNHGNVFQQVGTIWSNSENFIKVDTSRKYKMRITVRQVKDPTNGDNKDYFFSGFATYDYRKQLQTTSPGAHRYFVASGVRLNASDGWRTFEGVITGEGNASHSQFRNGTVYVRPMFILNYNGGNGTAQVSKIEIWDATEELENAASIKTTNETIATKESAMAKRVSSVESKANDNASKISSVEKSLTTKESALSKRINDLNATVKNKADNSTVSALSKRVSTAETNIKGKASASEVATLSSTVTVIKDTGLPYTEEIMVGGDADKFYPVYIRGGDQNRMRRIVVYRSFSWTAPDTWNTRTHKGGLTLDINANFGGWGGAAYAWWINDCRQIYSVMFAGAGNRANSIYFVVFLRGGGARYRFSSDQELKLLAAYGGSKEVIWQSGTYKAYADNPLPISSYWTNEQINAHKKGTKDYAGLSKVDNLSAADIRKPVEDKLTASIKTINQTITTKDQARANQITQLSSSINSKTTSIEQKLTTTANKVGGLESKYSVKIDNNGLISGFGLLSTANNGATTSEFGVRADKFFIGAPARANVDARDNKYPFIVKNGVVYMRSAMIQNGSIDTAKIANVIQSTNYRAGSKGWRLNKSGPSEFNEDVVVNASIKAERIVGDIVSAISKPATTKTQTIINRSTGLFGTVTISEARPYDRTLIIYVGLRVTAKGQEGRDDSITGIGYVQTTSTQFGNSKSFDVVPYAFRGVEAIDDSIAQVTYNIPKGKTGTINIYGYQGRVRGYRGNTYVRLFPVNGNPDSASSSGVFVAQLFKNGSDLS